jgi:hypothetical protein
VIAYFDKAVVVTMSVRPLRGAQDCEMGATFALTITLDQVLGNRKLLDGGRFPPRDATAPA